MQYVTLQQDFLSLWPSFDEPFAWIPSSPGSMSTSSPEPSPTSATDGGRTFSKARDSKFTVEIPSPRLQVVTNGTNGANGTKGAPTTNGNSSLISPLKSPHTRHVQSFSREGILGSAQKARNLSQSSGDRESMVNGLRNQQHSNSDDGVNPLKRRNTDAAIDYPRRRATIAVSGLVTALYVC